MGVEFDQDCRRAQDARGTCYRIAQGHVRRMHIPRGGLDISEIQSAPGALIPRAHDRAENDEWDKAAITVANIAKRITPHATWYCAPGFDGVGPYFATWFGKCFMDGSVILVRTDLSEYHVVSTALHEAWHALEELLTNKEMQAVTDAADLGIKWQGEYMDSSVECRARAFESFALYRLQTPTKPRTGRLGRLADRIVRVSLPAHERIFLAALEGRIGRRAIKRKWIPSTRLDPELVAAVEHEAAAKVTFAQAVREEWYGAGRILADVGGMMMSPVRRLVT